MQLRALKAVVFVAVVGGVAGVLSAQTAQGPAFEVASIKPNKSGPPRSLGPDPPGRVVLPFVTVSTLVSLAYRVRDAQVVGAPGWAESEPFDSKPRPGARCRRHRARS
jgi:uncharacterized protein (TIGR03435 family)